MATKLKGEVPPELGLLGVKNGTALHSFLPNAQREDGPSGAGWWFWVQFAAKPAQYQSSQ